MATATVTPNTTTPTTTTTAPTMEELKARIAQLEKEQGEAKQAKYSLSFKVSEKGGVSVYGLGRFPVTLYAEQWGALLGGGDRIKGFIERNLDKLKLKGE